MNIPPFPPNSTVAAIPAVPLTVSVALCTYNGERFLSEQLASLAAQTRLPDEVVICDDGSSDRTMEILESWKNSVRFTVRIFQNETNLGFIRNFEKAMTLCESDVIFCCDQDDIWKFEKIAKMTEIMEKNPEVGLVYCDADVIDENSADAGLLRKEFARVSMNFYHPYFVSPYTRTLQEPCGCCMAFRSKYRKYIFPIPETPPDSVFHDMWIYYLLPAVTEFRYEKTSYMRCRIHGKNISATLCGTHRETLREKEKIMRFFARTRTAWYFKSLPHRNALEERLKMVPESRQKEKILRWLHGNDVHYINRARVERNFFLFWPFWLLEIVSGRYFERMQPIRCMLHDVKAGILRGLNPVSTWYDLKSVFKKRGFKLL